ncbi:MAG: flagellin [Methanolinea sp.]|jgi:hypothetical protein|nr:flagellin [Methanolinea sp.]
MRLGKRREFAKRDRETGITGLEVIFLILFLAIAVYMVFTLAIPPVGHGGSPGGLFVRAVQESGDSVRVTGMPIGYLSVSQKIEGIAAVAATENKNAIGFLVVSVTPLIGDLAIDINRMGITIVSPDTDTTFTRSRNASVGPGNWTILKKYNLIPMKTADEDDILEASEIFDLLISLPEPFPPYHTFSLVFSPEHGIPYTQKLTVPPAVTRVTRFV